MQRRQGVSSSIRIREASLLDVPRIAKIEKKVYPRPWSWDAFFSEFFKSYSRIFVAECNGRVCGYLVLWLFPPEAYIANVAVDPESQGKGVGSALLEHVVAYCQDEQISCITLEVRRSNLRAQALYKRFGFEVVGIRRGMYHDGEDGLIMEKLL